MLNKINKPMFFYLLIPFYFIILTCLIGMSMGSIEWKYVLINSSFIIMAAWTLSKNNSLLINMIGLTIFVTMGILLIYSTLTATTQSFRTISWRLNIFCGIELVLIGLVAITYDIVRLKRNMCKNK